MRYHVGVLLIASLLFALFFCLESHAESSVCEVLDPDGSYVSEMLVEPSSLGLASGARYQRRVALVVGNSQYSFVSKLKNPTNDASAMARLLQALGFTVFKGVDLDAASLTACVEAYVQALDREPTSLSAFYYAGHGVQLQSSSDGDKRNYMLATDALVDASGKGRGFQQIDPILSQMRSRSEQAVFFYDACRSDPLGERAPLDVNGEKIKRQALIGGAAAIEVDEGSVSDQAELYIAYATAPNMVADDAYEQNAEHSPFTFALLRHLGTPGYSLQRVMSGVSSDVGDLTDWNQTPWTSSSLTRDVHLNGSLTFAQLSERSDALARESDVLLAEGRRYDALKTALMGLPANRALADDQAFHKAKAAAVAAFNAPVNVVKRHGDYISSVDLSPDGKTILSASHDGVVMLTDYDSGKLLLTLKGHDAAVMHASFNEDATKAASIDADGQLIVWDLGSGGTMVSISTTDLYAARGLIFRQQRIILVRSGDIEEFDSITGAVLSIHSIQELMGESYCDNGEITKLWRSSLADHAYAIIKTSFESGQSSLVCHGDLYRVGFMPRIQLEYRQEAIDGVRDGSISRDGSKLVLMGETKKNDEYPLYVTTFQVLEDVSQKYRTFEAKVNAEHISFSGDGSLVLLANDYTLHVYDQNTGQPISRRLITNQDGLETWDSLSAISSRSGELPLSHVRHLMPGANKFDVVVSIYASADSKYVGSVTTLPENLKRLSIDREWRALDTLSSKNQLVMFGYDGVSLLDMHTTNLIESFTVGALDDLQNWHIDPQGEWIFLGFSSGRIGALNKLTNVLNYIPLEVKDAARPVEFDNFIFDSDISSELLIRSSDLVDENQFVDLSTLLPMDEKLPDSPVIQFIENTEDGPIIFASFGNKLMEILLETATRPEQNLRTYQNLYTPRLSIKISPDRLWLATESIDKVDVWSRTDASHRLTLRYSDTSIYGLDFSPDGKSLAILTSGYVHIVDLISGIRIAYMSMHGGCDLCNSEYEPADVHPFGYDRSGDVLWVPGRSKSGIVLYLQPFANLDDVIGAIEEAVPQTEMAGRIRGWNVEMN